MHKVTVLILLACSLLSVQAQNSGLKPITKRVNVQADTARTAQIIDGEWVAVGTNKKHAISYDYTLPFEGKPSFRFELKEDDNTLSGYGKGETKGRAELSYCYATSADFDGQAADAFENAVRMKTVYHYGKGICKQGERRKYTFSVYIPSGLREDVSTIFAQWHGMPDRTLVSSPEGIVKKLTIPEFLDMYDRMIFKKNIAHDKIKVTDKNGAVTYKAGKANGWLIEQGGYPPLAFGFSKGYFYIKANSDRKWLSDKTDRCNADVEKSSVMKPVTSDYKASTIAYKLPFARFPKNCWITFVVDVKWTEYSGMSEEITSPGKLDVRMSYNRGGRKVDDHIVKNETISIGRNDEDGYYFKFGIYRVGNSSVPVCYNLADYSEEKLNISIND